ncbi:MAG TPA: winged helix-turn-helix domain-containing protein [Alloacidobacterium sp.]|nr:winged helix-turn-helix domain-containing protein [Alloacidobacterium sp.]
MVSPKAFEVLTYLVANAGRVVTKDELLKAVWPDSFVEESNLAQHISSLRKALGDKSTYIATVPGRGYQFTANVQAESSADGYPETSAQEILVHRVREHAHMVIEETSPAPASTASPGKTGALQIPVKWIAGSVLLAGLIAVVVTYAVKRLSKPPELRKVVIADFLNLTGDPSFDRSLESAFAAGLGQSPYIQLMGTSEEQSALATMEKAPDTPLLGDIALEVCRRKDYQALLNGKIEQSGIRYELTMEVLGCGTGKSLAVFRAEAANKDVVLDTLDDIAERVRRKLGESSQSIARFQVPIREATTFSFEALKAYDIGSDLGNAGKYEESINYFQKAADLDPKFAEAQASLGTAYYDMGSVDKANEYYTKAFDLSSNVTELEKIYIRSNYYIMAQRDLIAGRENFEQWSQLYPAQESPWIDLAVVNMQLGDFPAAIEAGEHSVRYVQIRPPLAYANLAQAYMRENRFADAKRTIAEAQALGKDSPLAHHILLQIAMMEQDRGALQREVEWSNKNPQLYFSLETQAIFEAAQGRYPRSEQLFQSAVVDAQKEVNSEVADNLRLVEAEVEIELGRTARATELLRQIKDRDDFDFAIASARAGDLSAALALLRKPEQFPHGTFEHNVYLPEMRSLIALNRGDTAGAVAALEPSIPYELAISEVIYLRALAFLAARQGAKAQEEFQKLIDHPALDDAPYPRTTLARLGLARAYALEGNVSASRDEYAKFLALWKDADPDVPALQQARSEFARLEQQH